MTEIRTQAALEELPRGSLVRDLFLNQHWWAGADAGPRWRHGSEVRMDAWLITSRRGVEVLYRPDLPPQSKLLARIERLQIQVDSASFLQPDTVEQPKTVGDIRAAIDGLPDEAQAFINISGHGEDYAIAEVIASEQIPDGEPWPTDKRTIGLEIHLGLFPEHPAAEEEAESDA